MSATSGTAPAVDVTYASLANVVDMSVSNQGQANALKSTLRAMENARTPQAMAGQRQAFTQLVEAQRGRA